MQAHFQGRPAVLREFANSPQQHLSPRLVHFPLSRDTVYEAHCLQVWSDSLRSAVRKSIVLRPTLLPYRSGEAGSPRPYALREDDLILSTLLLSIFLMVWIVARSWRFLRDTFKDFFRQRHRANLFTDRQDTMLQGRWYTLLQTSFLQSILYFEYVRLFQPDTFEHLSPYALLGCNLVVLLGYYVLKAVLYKWVNSTFFQPQPRWQWGNQWFISILSMGTALVPLTLLVVFFDLSGEVMLLAYVLLMGLIKILLFYKTKRIFFNSLLGALHVILYFCTLEIAPLFGLWVALGASTYWLAALL